MNVVSWLKWAALTCGGLLAVTLGEMALASYEQPPRWSAGPASTLRRKHGLEPSDSVKMA